MTYTQRMNPLGNQLSSSKPTLPGDSYTCYLIPSPPCDEALFHLSVGWRWDVSSLYTCVRLIALLPLLRQATLAWRTQLLLLLLLRLTFQLEQVIRFRKGHVKQRTRARHMTGASESGCSYRRGRWCAVACAVRLGGSALDRSGAGVRRGVGWVAERARRVVH